MNKFFDNLFVLEIANNHWGSLERGKQIVREFAKIVNDNKQTLHKNSEAPLILLA